MLRIDDYRQAFVHLDGISTLVSVLSGRVNFQIQYQLSFCMWVLTFNPAIAEKMNKYVMFGKNSNFTMQNYGKCVSVQIWSHSHLGRYLERRSEGEGQQNHPRRVQGMKRAYFMR